MRYGFTIPTIDIHTGPELAAEAEAAGWDAVFIPDCISIDTPTYPATPTHDPWIVLAAIALHTHRVRMGPLLTPVSRRRPWKLARETMTLDHLSGGRLTLAVGLGAAGDDGGFYKVGEAMDLQTRAELLDEGLAILDGLWRGRPLTFTGRHYRVEGLTLLPPPVQQPRIPIWVVGAWPRPHSLARALRWDGIIPTNKAGTDPAMTPADIAALRAYIAEHRPAAPPFDIVVEGATPGDDPARAAAQVRPFAEAGVTWWLEEMWALPNDFAYVRARIRQGPPRTE